MYKKVALKKILNHILYQWSCLRPSVRSQNSLPFLKNSRPSFVLIRLDFGIALASLHTINLVQSFQKLCHLPCESQSNGFPLSELAHHLLITWHKIYKKYFQPPCPFKILFFRSNSVIMDCKAVLVGHECVPCACTRWHLMNLRDEEINCSAIY